MSKSLEETLRDLAARGEISHLSLTPSQNGKMWRASYAMCSTFGVSWAEDKDPVQAILIALTSAKLKRPRVSITLKSEPEPAPAPAPASGDDFADLM